MTFLNWYFIKQNSIKVNYGLKNFSTLISLSSTTNANGDHSRIGILLCGHGSRDPKAVREFQALVGKLKSRMPSIPFEYGFLEFNQPIIRIALDNKFRQIYDGIFLFLFITNIPAYSIASLVNSF